MANKTLNNVRFQHLIDTAENWATSEKLILQGEIAIESDTGKFKIGLDAEGKKYSELEYASSMPNNHTEVTLEAGQNAQQGLATIENPEEGDTAVIIEKIGEAGEKKSYTAYVYDDAQWKAMDGNYSAQNVYFPEDLVTTSAIGNITLQNGQATIPAAGKNLTEVWTSIFVKEQNPTVTQPAVTVKCPEAKAYEVGTKVIPTFTATLSAGSYQFGPATGITATSWSVTDSNSSEPVEAATGSFDQITVTDTTKYKITATAQHGAGTTPKTNTGNDYAAGQIKAGSKSASSGEITGYRNSFYGTTEDKEAITSETVRSLAGKSGKALANGAKFNVTVPLNAMRVIIAYPSTLRALTSVLDVNGLNAEIKPSFTETTLTVQGAEEEVGISYRVYSIEYAKPNNTANTYAVTI